jgi:two-component system NtrC family sensor kinase
MTLERTPAEPPLPWYRRLYRRGAQALARLALEGDVTAELRADRARLSAELSRRLGELYALQELAHVLSASFRFGDVVAEVARYAMRALDASGAVVLLAPEDGGAFEVVAAKGVLAAQLRRRIDPESGGVVLDAIGHEQLELRAGDGAPLVLLAGCSVHAAVAVPLRAHGVTVGAIAVVDKLVGTFSADDARLLSTAATHAAVVLANARYFELVRDGKEQWEATFDALTEGIVLVDRDTVIRRANDAMAVIAGRKLDRVVGQHLGDALFGDRPAVADLVAAARAGRRPPAVVRRGSAGRILRVAASPLTRPTAEASAVVVVEDITEQKALESQLMQSEKLASVGTMVSGVAHELNNPLTSIAGLSEFLLEQGIGDEPSREHLRVINDQAERASRIVRNLLSFAHQSPAERSSLDLGDVAERTVALMGYEMRRMGIDLQADIPSDLPPLLGNRDELQQVLLNLLTNAAYAVGRLPPGAPRKITVSVAAAAERVVLRVADTGPGIAPEAAAKLFDPFYTTKPLGEGTGLGLFLAYGIAETHGGSLTASSTPGEGATFTLSLPRAPRDGVEPAPSSPAATVPRGAGAVRRILVVDDDPVVLRLVRVLFEHDGHRVDTATNGTEALQFAMSDDYDLVIADRRAAAGNEPFVTVLERVRPAWTSRMVLAATDRPNTVSDQLPSLRLLSKPFNLRDLRMAAAAVWGADRE